MKRLFNWYFSWFLFLYGLILLISYTTQDILLFEWVISFSPHAVVFSGLLLVMAVMFLAKRKLKVSSFFLISLVLVVVGTLFIGIKVITFTVVLPEKEIGKKTVTIAFFNKNYKNTNYEAIDQVIQRIKPDVIGFTEIGYSDLAGIKTLQNYPYASTTIGDNSFTFGLFSRYPMEPLPIADSLIKNKAFVYRLMLNGVSYTVVGVHTLPPVNSWSMESRNKELKAIQKYVINSGVEKTILMGDFNITPWSKTYDEFTSGFKELKNVSKGQGLHLTWGFFPVLAQIDHIFVPKQFNIETFGVEYVQGSDHRLIWSRVGL